MNVPKPMAASPGLKAFGRRGRLSLLGVLLLLPAWQVLAQASTEVADGASASFGRLFFTPERRAALSRHRLLNLPQDEKLGEDNSLTLNGVVVRGSGKRTVWINGVPVTERTSLLDVQPRNGRPGSAHVTVGDEAPTTLNVGNTLNRGSGQVSSALGDGWIRVRER